MGKTETLPVVVIYKKTKSKGAKTYMNIYEDISVDDLINTKKRNPVLPNNYEIVEIGVGNSFIKRYKEKYKL